MNVATTTAINPPIPLTGHSKEIDNVVKTLITIHNRGIELTPWDTAIILAAKVGMLLQFLTSPTVGGFNLHAKLTLGTDAVVCRKGYVKWLRLPPLAAPILILAATVAHNLALYHICIPTKVTRLMLVRSASVCQPTTFGTNHILLVNALSAKSLKDGAFVSGV
jgi:hypothetical protein